jgi:hypothetical protein
MMDRETLIAAIENAARQSVPDPDYEVETSDDVWEPQTLERFVDGTYISDRADHLFRVAAEAAADAVLALLP